MKEQSQPIKEEFCFKGTFQELAAYLAHIKKVVPIIEKSN